MLIVAGAGTGKTNTLAHRVAPAAERVAPERILLLTFTRRAAREMMRRAERSCTRPRDRPGRRHPNATRMLWTGTFHSIGNRLLRHYAHVLGLDPVFSVIDRGDSADLIDLNVTELGFAKRQSAFRAKTPASPSIRTASTRS